MFDLFITNLQEKMSTIDIVGIIFGHLIAGVAITFLVDWKWLKKLTPKEEKK